MRIGVFDSGIGGEAIAASLRVSFPDFDIVQASDAAHMPYGSRTPAEILQLTAKAIQPLVSADCDVIVIACNTATAVALPQLRLDYPAETFIGIEPMIKAAAQHTKTKVVAVCATKATLKSSSYLRSKRQYGARLQFIEPDCSDWATLIERNQINQEHIDGVVEYCLSLSADVIVLGCTHYHWIKDEIVATAGPNVVVLEPSQAIVRRVKELLNL